MVKYNSAEIIIFQALIGKSNASLSHFLSKCFKGDIYICRNAFRKNMTVLEKNTPYFIVKIEGGLGGYSSEHIRKEERKQNR